MWPFIFVEMDGGEHEHNNILLLYATSSDPGFACDYSTRSMLSGVYVSVREKPLGGKRRVFFVVQCRTRGPDPRVTKAAFRQVAAHVSKNTDPWARPAGWTCGSAGKKSRVMMT